MTANNLTGKKQLLVIGGATATGKTAMAIRLARQFNTEILSADSRQFYREMSIGTAKPSAEELAAVPHHFINSLSVADDYSVGDFERDALARLGQIFEKNDYAVMAGGSGLYLQAVCSGMDRFPEVPPEVRVQVEEGYAQDGLAWLQQQLAALDPQHFAAVDQRNPARLRRAVEVCLASGQPYSAFLRHTKPSRSFRPVYLLLEQPREVLYARIDARVDAMIDAGLEAEARGLLPWRERPALRTVGYEEWFDYFDGKCSRMAAIEKIKQHTRNYAKRQATWFRKYGEWKTIDQTQQAYYPYQ
jgi:tRNA dimethylallyltransferase